MKSFIRFLSRFLPAEGSLLLAGIYGIVVVFGVLKTYNLIREVQANAKRKRSASPKEDHVSSVFRVWREYGSRNEPRGMSEMRTPDQTGCETGKDSEIRSEVDGPGDPGPGPGPEEEVAGTVSVP